MLGERIYGVQLGRSLMDAADAYQFPGLMWPMYYMEAGKYAR